ncbi:MAG: AEC family transporter [Roseovarius sp.]|nr:AEC family transporter [Roseovarius sp.]MCY4317058.1 AEC family transporter [Roseovarius sp.]
MLDIFLQTVPFFMVIGLGYLAGFTGFLTEEATAYLTKFVFYFALSAMLFRFAANLTLGEILDWQIVMAYLCATGFLYLLIAAVALLRGLPIREAAFEAQCGVIGNTGFLGAPMLTMLMGESAIGPVVLLLAIDLIVFGSLIVIIATGTREGRLSFNILGSAAIGLIKNPMIVSITLGLLWSASDNEIPAVMDEFLLLLGGAATPGALFAIGATLASKSAERPYVASWLSLNKLVLHPLLVAFAALVVFSVDPYAAAVIIAAAALPVAGNIYILAQHYQIAPQRVSASILISTAASVATVSLVIGWVGSLYAQ